MTAGLLDLADLASQSGVPADRLLHDDAAHLPDAVNLPGELTAELAAWLAPPPARTVVTYCAGPSCGRYRAAAAAFTRLGYPDVRVYAGGKTDWADAGLPFEGAHAIGTAA